MIQMFLSVLASSVVDRGLEPQSGQTKDNNIYTWCFSTLYAALRGKSNDWWSRNQYNVPEWSNILIRGLLF